MATINAVITDISQDGSVSKISWPSVTNTNSDGAPVVSCEWADRCVSVDGTFGGATITIQGSNDGTNWYTLNNAQGTALTFTAAGMKQIVEVPYFTRPLLTGGAGSTLNIIMVARRANPLRS